MKQLPVWIGWPGTGPAPGHDWLPGSKFRFVTLFFTYAFLALALTVDYAYSATFFLLAIIGMYVGFRRGFVNGLTRTEKFVMMVFAVYPAVAVVSYLFGTQTDVGFRFLGRDLRFVLFIPVYLAIRWSRPRPEHFALALTGGAVGACVMGFLQRNTWPLPQGVTGTHIVFGDLALLSGLLAAAFLWPPKGEFSAFMTQRWKWAAILIAVGSGLAASILAKAGGSWLAVPVLACFFALAAPFGQSPHKLFRVGVLVSMLLVMAAAIWFLSPVRDRIKKVWQNSAAYVVAANSRAINAKCLDQEAPLRVLLQASYSFGSGSQKIMKLTDKERDELSGFGCRGNYAAELSNLASNSKPFEVGLYRGRGPANAGPQSATILAQGAARFNVGWKGAAVQINASKNWREYTAIGRDSQIRSAIIDVMPGDRILFVPMQKQRGEFIYPLVTSSVGRRIEMWRESWALFLVKPWMGVGTGAFHAYNESYIRSRLVGDYEHAHSDYFTSMGTKGIIGLLSLILLLSVLPIALGNNSESTMGKTRSATLQLAVIFSVAFSVFGLTETMFVHSMVISWYTVASVSILVTGSSLNHDGGKQAIAS